MDIPKFDQKGQGFPFWPLLEQSYRAEVSFRKVRNSFPNCLDEGPKCLFQKGRSVKGKNRRGRSVQTPLKVVTAVGTEAS